MWIKCQVFSSSSQTSPVEQPIHQQESDWLRGSGSPYTMSHTTICVPLYLFTLTFFFPISYLCIIPPPFHPENSLPMLTSGFSPSLWASVCLFPLGTITLSFPPPTGWAVKQERAHGRPLTSRNAALEVCCRHTGFSMVDQHCSTNGTCGLAAIHCEKSSAVDQVHSFVSNMLMTVEAYTIINVFKCVPALVTLLI